MESGSIPKLLAKLAIPAVVAQIVNLLYNIVDRIYIGHMADVGAAALTGVGLFTPILMLIMAFAMLAGAGGAPRAAISMGEKDVATAEKRTKSMKNVLQNFRFAAHFLVRILFRGGDCGNGATLFAFGCADALDNKVGVFLYPFAAAFGIGIDNKSLPFGSSVASFKIIVNIQR